MPAGLGSWLLLFQNTSPVVPDFPSAFSGPHDLLCVIEDGRIRDPTLPIHIGRDVVLPRGMDATCEVAVVHSDGAPVDLSPTDVSLLLVIRKRSTYSGSIRKLTATKRPNFGRNRATFNFYRSDFDKIAPGRYVFDIWLLQGTERFQIFPLSIFVLQPGTPL